MIDQPVDDARTRKNNENSDQRTDQAADAKTLQRRASLMCVPARIRL